MSGVADERGCGAGRSEAAVSDTKQPVTITMPLYCWLMLVGALGNMADSSWYDGLVDKILDQVQP